MQSNIKMQINEPEQVETYEYLCNSYHEKLELHKCPYHEHYYPPDDYQCNCCQKCIKDCENAATA